MKHYLLMCDSICRGGGAKPVAESSWTQVAAEEAPAFNKTINSSGISYLPVGK